MENKIPYSTISYQEIEEQNLLRSGDILEDNEKNFFVRQCFNPQLTLSKIANFCGKFK